MPKSRMNRALMRKVADKLESLRGKRRGLWNQRRFIKKTEYGTAHCIGGWAIVIHGTYAKKLERWGKWLNSPRPGPAPRFYPWETAQRLLGLTDSESTRLFRSEFMWRKTPQQVAARLREFARTGRVEA